ncbi:adenosine deaminase [Corynebacterium kalinowskii]|uniref:adenosine deaminase n=1 Tax=Corynebacterium kalinowskii TaxID=2675216 RepID=A0A6B8VUZ7_9CORY|nr:hypothetical protein [Corynebacterium kalinowskii]QGU02755.1 adenosine deaminase [Corynebacterium kalinowskii]
MHEEVEISPEFKSIGQDIVAELPKVVLRHLVAAGEVGQQLQALVDDGVVYAELSVRVANEEELHAALHAVTAAEQSIVARIVVAIDSLADAELAAAHRGIVVGCALEGDPDPQLVQYLRENFLPFTVAANVGEGLQSLYAAVVAGADRIAGAISLYEDFTVELEGISAGALSTYVRDREIPLELSLSADVTSGVVEEVGDHPLPLLQQLGFNCTLNPCGPTLTEEMTLLVEGFDYGLEELFDLTVNAIEAAFAPIELRRTILQERIAPAYQRFAEDLVDSAESEDEL